MRAAEALMLGSFAIEPVAGMRSNGTGGGCALGMIQYANGRDMNGEIKRDYPWLSQDARIPLPCEHETTEHLMLGGCDMFERRGAVSFGHYVVHLFNWHVMHAKDWTITQLAEWIDSVDPTKEVATQKEKADEALGIAVAR